MWKLVIFVASLWIYPTSVGRRVTKCKCGTSKLVGLDRRIAGGTPVQPHEFPWQAEIFFNQRPYCGGCLLNNRYVITAAHCIHNRRPARLLVLLGAHNYLDPDEFHWAYAVHKLIVHPKYTPKRAVNDIGLIKLRVTLGDFNPIMIPPCFPRPGINYAGRTAFVSGWGKTGNKHSPSSSTLLKTNLKILSHWRCRSAYGLNVVLTSLICSGWPNGVKDACLGDSGSALVTRRRGRWFIVGLVSSGFGCARPRSPGLYTRVDKYYDWLDRNTRDAKYCTY